MQVDFEERVDFRRLHEYRLARTRNALAKSGLGALLVFDQYNIRYISSTVIGEWARDKLTRWCLLTGNGEPWVWDFGSAARHHRLYAPWLPANHWLRRARRAARRGVTRRSGLFEAAAKEIKDILDEEGVAEMPLGIDVVEPPFLFALQKLGHRGAGRPAGDARRARDQEPRRDHAAQHGGGDGRRRLPGHLRGAEARRARERDRRDGDEAPLRDGLGLRGGDQRDRRRALQPASAQLHRPHDPPRRPGLLRHHPDLHGLQDLLLPHVHGGQRDAGAARRLQEGARSGWTARSRMLKPGVSTDEVAKAFPKSTEIGFETEMSAFGLNFCHGLGLGLHERPLISRLNSFKDPYELKAGMVFAVETFCPAKDGVSAARIEEEVVLTPQRGEDHHALPGAGAADCQQILKRVT